MSVKTFTGSDAIFTGNLTVLGAITGNVTVSGASFAQVIAQNLTPNGFIYPTTSGITPGLFVSTAAATNGQLLVGSTGSVPVAATLTGTANEIIVTNGAGTITLSTPQAIGTGSSVSFANLTLSGQTAKGMIYLNTTGQVTSTVVANSGQILIGSTGAIPVLGNITGTANQIVVTNGAGTIGLSLPQSIATSSSVSFGSVAATSGVSGSTLTASGLTQNGIVYAGSGGLLTTTSVLTNGQVLIGSTGNAPVIATLSGANGITVTNAPGSITIGNSQVFPTTSITSNSYTTQTSDTYIGINFAGTVNISLISGASAGQGKVYFIKDESGSASLATRNITVIANGADKIDGQSTAVIGLNFGSLTLLWNTTHWSII